MVWFGLAPPVSVLASIIVEEAGIPDRHPNPITASISVVSS